MTSIATKNNLILYCGNTAGYVEDGKTVLDPTSKNGYLIRFLQGEKGLEPCWQDGVYDHLVHGKVDLTGGVKPSRNCKLHQLRPEVPPGERFLDFEDQVSRRGMPDSSRYEVVYGCQIETDDLGAIYAEFGREFPQRTTGHPISTPDALELCDRQESEFYYVDHYGFQKIRSTQGQSLDIQRTGHMRGEDISQRQPIQEMKEA